MFFGSGSAQISRDSLVISREGKIKKIEFAACQSFSHLFNPIVNPLYTVFK